MSADTAARSLRKLARFVSTEARTPSQAAIDRCKSSNLASSASAFGNGQQGKSSVHIMGNKQEIRAELDCLEAACIWFGGWEEASS